MTFWAIQTQPEVKHFLSVRNMPYHSPFYFNHYKKPHNFNKPTECKFWGNSVYGDLISFPYQWLILTTDIDFLSHGTAGLKNIFSKRGSNQRLEKKLLNIYI